MKLTNSSTENINFEQIYRTLQQYLTKLQEQSMSRDLDLYLTDIICSINKIQKYTSRMTDDDLLADNKTFDAVIHNLQIIGEATKQISEAVRQ